MALDPAEGGPGLSESAIRRQRAAVDVLREAVDQLMQSQQWLERRLKDSMAASELAGNQ